MKTLIFIEKSHVYTQNYCMLGNGFVLFHSSLIEALIDPVIDSFGEKTYVSVERKVALLYLSSNNS